MRNANDLSEMLLDPNTDLSLLEASSNNLVKEAADIANGKRAIGLAAVELSRGQENGNTN